MTREQLAKLLGIYKEQIDDQWWDDIDVEELLKIINNLKNEPIRKIRKIRANRKIVR